MKLNNRGWGYRMMIFLMSILVAFLFVAVVLIYLYYDEIKASIPSAATYRISEVER